MVGPCVERFVKDATCCKGNAVWLQKPGEFFECAYDPGVPTETHYQAVCGMEDASLRCETGTFVSRALTPSRCEKNRACTVALKSTFKR